MEPKMKFGLCAKLELMEKAAALGFDYLEPPVNGVAAMSEEAFAQSLEEAKRIGLPCPAFNLLFPKTMQLLSPEVADAQIAAYLHGALARVRLLGGQIAVFGSGKSRNRPEGMRYEEAFRRLAEVTRMTGEIAGEYGVTIVIEPLNRGESNMICSMAEGAALVAAANHPNVALLCDYYHAAREGEPLEDIVRLGGVRHAHIAAREGRRYPVEPGADDFGAFFACLRATGYQGLMSVEGKTDDMEADAPRALELLKKLEEEG